MSPNDLNLYEFFRDVAIKYQADVLGIRAMTARRQIHLDAVLSELQKEYFEEGRIDYDDPDRMIAYTLSFAPKHALIWKKICTEILEWTADGDAWLLNSIGPGPGSDIFGQLCGLGAAVEDGVDVIGLEPVDGWRDLFEIARSEFIDRTGFYFDALMTKDPQNLHQKGQTIGSFVLSDAARSDTLDELLEDLKANLSVEKAWFLDFPAYTCPADGLKYLNEKIRSLGFRCWDDHLPKLNLQFGTAIMADMDDCDPIYCRRPVNGEPKVNFYKVTLN